MGFLPWEIRVAFPGEIQLWQSRATYPTVHAGCFSVFIIHQTLTWTTGSLTCTQMLMQAIACGGCTNTRKRVFTECWLGEKKPLPHRGIEPASAAWRSDALTNWATSPLLSILQLVYVSDAQWLLSLGFCNLERDQFSGTLDSGPPYGPIVPSRSYNYSLQEYTNKGNNNAWQTRDC